MVGMSEAGISGAINGSATRETIDKIAKALEVSPSDLIVGEELYAKFSSDKTPLKFGNIKVPCYVMNNGQRVFSGRFMSLLDKSHPKKYQQLALFDDFDFE